MEDYIITGMAAENQVRFFAATTKNMVETAREKHNLSPIASAALGRLMTAGAMMGAMCKNDDDVITLQMQGAGPMKGITVTANAKADVKGYVEVPDVLLPPNAVGKLDVGGAIGEGFLRVIKDIGLKEPYVGQIELVTGEVAEDLTYYFATSEQIPTSVALGVLMNKENTVRQAGGFIVQLMPFAEEKTIASLEEKLAQFSSITSCLDEGKAPEDIIAMLFDDYEITAKLETRFHCNCSKEYVAKALISVGKKELKQMIADGEDIEVNCHFCNSHYKYNIDDLNKLLAAAI
ncbi:MAG: Hsp33 family molecular chaperone HslO [Lachnospiraceae bacterium]|nr:Hsp33 family molecular chaperone HslO [Lachnospiraceae bacterium]